MRRLDVEGCGEQAGNALLHVVFEPLSVGRGGAVTKPHDYSLLQSWRREGEGQVVASAPEPKPEPKPNPYLALALALASSPRPRGT